MDRLPDFTFPSYRALLSGLRVGGYELQTVGTLLQEVKCPVVYLRHDIDFFPGPALEMGRMEAALGGRATYYFLLSGPYNLFTVENRGVLRTLAQLGHEIGLHYDLQTYSTDPQLALRQLESEVAILSDLSGTSVSTISLHQPHLTAENPFRELDHYVQPHDTRDQRPLTYVSESCRAWRDETLLNCFSPARPERLLLLTHPELWLEGTIQNRLEYLEKIVLPHAHQPLDTYYLQTVRKIWSEHPGGRAHDRRVLARAMT